MSEVDLQRVLDTLPQFIFWKDRESKYLGANKNLSDAAGYPSPAAMIGKSDYDMPWGKENSDWYRECDRKVMDSGEAELKIQEPQERPDGSTRWLETSKFPLRDDAGEVVGMMGFFEDVTERKLAEDRLAAAEERYRQIVETANEWMWETGADDRISYTNSRADILLGIDSDEVLGHEPWTWVVEEGRDSARDQFELLKAGGQPFSGWRLIFERSGERRVLETCGVPIVEQNEVTGFRCVTRDVTGQVRKEAELREKVEVITRQQEAISRLSTPIMQVWDGVLCLPIVGTVDTQRSAHMTDALLHAVVERQASCVIVDVTGIDVMDTGTADHFIKMAKAIRLLGAHPVLSGISPAIAQTMAQLGVDLSSVTTLRTLQDGLEAYLAGDLDGEHDGAERS